MNSHVSCCALGWGLGIERKAAKPGPSPGDPKFCYIFLPSATTQLVKLCNELGRGQELILCSLSCPLPCKLTPPHLYPDGSTRYSVPKCSGDFSQLCARTPLLSLGGRREALFYQHQPLLTLLKGDSYLPQSHLIFILQMGRLAEGSCLKQWCARQTHPSLHLHSVTSAW